MRERVAVKKSQNALAHRRANSDNYLGKLDACEDAPAAASLVSIRLSSSHRLLINGSRAFVRPAEIQFMRELKLSRATLFAEDQIAAPLPLRFAP